MNMPIWEWGVRFGAFGGGAIGITYGATFGWNWLTAVVVACFAVIMAFCLIRCLGADDEAVPREDVP